MTSGADVVFNTTVPPRVAPFLEQLHDVGFSKRGGRLVCTYFEENILGLLPAAHVEGLYGCLDYYQTVSDPFSRELLARYDQRNPGGPKPTAGSAATGMYRGLKLWEAAVQEAGSLDQDAVVAARRSPRGAAGPRRWCRPAPPADEHVHRAGAEGGVRDRAEPRRHRSQGVQPRHEVVCREPCSLSPARRQPLHGVSVLILFHAASSSAWYRVSCRKPASSGTSRSVTRHSRRRSV